MIYIILDLYLLPIFRILFYFPANLYRNQLQSLKILYILYFIAYLLVFFIRLENQKKYISHLNKNKNKYKKIKDYL
jgi:hypothetical protein